MVTFKFFYIIKALYTQKNNIIILFVYGDVGDVGDVVVTLRKKRHQNMR